MEEVESSNLSRSTRSIHRRMRISGSARIVTALLCLAAIAIMGLIGWKYRRDRNRFQLTYTKSVKGRDISDTAREAISALQDAELREQDYLLTGETSYSEAYKKDMRDWEDESATLGLLAQHDRAAPLVRDVIENGSRVMNELAQIVSLYEAGSREAALDRVRKGSGIVYLEQARDAVDQIRQIDGLAADEADRSLITDFLRAQGRIVAAAAALFFLTLGALFLLFLEKRRRSTAGPETFEKQSAATAR